MASRHATDGQVRAQSGQLERYVDESRATHTTPTRLALMAVARSWIVALALLGCDAETSGVALPDDSGAPSAANTDEDTDQPQQLSPLVLDWVACDDGFECARALVPLDYSNPDDTQIQLAMTRLPALDKDRRIGSLFVNFGGPGAPAVALLHGFGLGLFSRLVERFDIVGFDPRGTGASEGAFDCHVNQEQIGMFSQPWARPGDNVAQLMSRAQAYVDACLAQDLSLLPHASTANLARDMDLLREAIGDPQLTYLGFSYGTFLGATYASLFPTKYRALVLDGGIDADQYINRPSESLREQTAAVEVALGRFFRACAENQAACAEFGGADPMGAFDRLVARANDMPLPAADAEGRTLDGDDLLSAAYDSTYDTRTWPAFAAALAAADRGDGRLARQLADSSYYRRDDGTYEPDSDGYYLLSAAEQRYPDDATRFLLVDEAATVAFPHFWWNFGYSEAPLALLPVRSEDVFYGPFSAASDAPPILVIGTTYDPATPYAGAERLVAELGNAVLLTMDGDGHTAYRRGSPCIDTAVEAYLEDTASPAPGTRCQQDLTF
jgi:pimeloyl-ACP methyl ester carboxylesterase